MPLSARTLTICEFFQLDGHACQLISFWNDSDCREPGGFEILYQRSSEPGFFNQDGIRSVLFRLRNRPCLQFRIKKSISYDLKEVVVALVVNEQGGAGRTIVGSINFDGRIPALNDVM